MSLHIVYRNKYIMPKGLLRFARDFHIVIDRSHHVTPQEELSESGDIDSIVSEYGLSDDGISEADFSIVSESREETSSYGIPLLVSSKDSSRTDWDDDTSNVTNDRQEKTIDQESYLPSIQVTEIDDLNGEPLFHQRGRINSESMYSKPFSTCFKTMLPQSVYRVKSLEPRSSVILDEKNSALPVAVSEDTSRARTCHIRSQVPTSIYLSEAVRPPIGMYLYGDDKNLSGYECLIRKHLEYFEPPKSARVTTTSHPWYQRAQIVGIRCRHCSHEPSYHGAMYPVPKGEIALTAHWLAMHHIVNGCPFVSSALRNEILCRTSDLDFTSTTCLDGSEQYWFETAKLCGIGSAKSLDDQQSVMLQWTTPSEPAEFAGRRHVSLQYYNYRSDRWGRGSKPVKAVPPGSMFNSSSVWY